ncbi:MAG: serine hydrolase [Luminiphilus sp.]|nr:serine hydrolase [Luminiphilus sp.]
MRFWQRLILVTTLGGVMSTTANERPAVMDGFPPSEPSQVTKKNHRDWPYNQWSFQNFGAPNNTVMVPRGGEIHHFPRDETRLSEFKIGGASLADVFGANAADALVVIQGDTLIQESYWNGMDPHRQHIWYSMTKSLVSSVAGILIESGQLDLTKTPADYIPELQGSAFDRVTVQQVMDHTSGLAFEENYVDPKSDFSLYYAPALNLGYLPGAADLQPGESSIYGVYDFLTQFVKPDLDTPPGQLFDYNSANADVLGWIVSRLMDKSLDEVIRDAVWQRIGAEHDAFIAVDRAYMPVATGGFNATARDSARFGVMIRDKGVYNGERILPASWLEHMLEVEASDLKAMAANANYAAADWIAYQDMWWVLDDAAGEFCAVGIHGQVIYINRSTDTVMVWFSSQRDAASTLAPEFPIKLNAARAAAKFLAE